MKAESMSQLLELGDKRVDAGTLGALCRRYDVKELSLFGSAARGDLRQDSDLDMMVEFEPGKRVGMFKFESLVEELEALAGRRIDLVTKRGLKPWIRAEALRDARVIYAA
jgi:predicted nucleotidyltransferase